MKGVRHINLDNYIVIAAKLLHRSHRLYLDKKYNILGKRKFKKAGLFNKKKLSKNYLRDTQKYWIKHYGSSINPLWHVAFMNYTGKEDHRYIPHYLWFSDFIPSFNNLSFRLAYLDKNLSDIFLNIKIKTPEIIIKKMHNKYYDTDNNMITRADALNEIKKHNEELIIKSSQTDNGFGIRKLEIINNELFLSGAKSSFEKIESIYGIDFVVQSKLKQHLIMAGPHPESANTIRIVTFRWMNEIVILLAFARFGTGGKITDNGATGGILCGIDDEGRLNAKGIDENVIIYTKHPTTDYSFSKREKIPSFEIICSHAKNMHKQIFHFDIVSWDFVIGEEGEPIFLEVNFLGESWMYQIAAEKPLFGSLTEDVLHVLRDKRKRLKKI